jgi:hypothetical protein
MTPPKEATMSVERAQKSEVHEATDDATSSPANRTDPDRARRAKDGDVTTRALDAGTPDVTNTRDRDADRSASPPSNFERGAAMADVHPDGDNDPSVPGVGAGPGASDGYSGGGPGSNNPDAETALRAGADRFDRGDAEQDRQKLFPDAPAGASAGGTAADDETRVRNDPDESTFGGPLRIDDPTTRQGDQR